VSMDPPIKLLPRNAAAFRTGRKASNAVHTVAGNPVSTRLESGVGNCFPGLECDLRNLERRFFPHIVVDISETSIAIVEVDRRAVDHALETDALDSASADTYRHIADDLANGRSWHIKSVQGTFGPLNDLRLEIRALLQDSANESPPDAWTAIRLLTEGTRIELEVQSGNVIKTLAGNRQHYLDDNGALASMFLPGELTQSLCSPWTHDFRDCGCFYWASNHPDIVKPARTEGVNGDPSWNLDVSWLRNDRHVENLPKPADDQSPDEFPHHEINLRWQELHFVLEGREKLDAYAAQRRKATPFSSLQAAESRLRYAAGVELAVMQMYLTAAYSLKQVDTDTELGKDVAAAYRELLRIAIGEMHHLRDVNDVLASIALQEKKPFVPALRVATRLPGESNNWIPQAATPEAMQAFLSIEAPSISVDGLYARILATLELYGKEEQEQTVRSIMAEGEDHFEAFLFIQEWLKPHDPSAYLIPGAIETSSEAHKRLQSVYLEVLQHLYDGYLAGLPAGANNINTARTKMVAAGGIAAAARAVADTGSLVLFAPIADERFKPIDPPTDET